MVSAGSETQTWKSVPHFVIAAVFNLGLKWDIVSSHTPPILIKWLPIPEDKVQEQTVKR